MVTSTDVQLPAVSVFLVSPLVSAFAPANPSPPKSTIPEMKSNSVADQTSIWKCVIADKSNGLATVSTPAKSKSVYSFTSSPATCTSSTPAPALNPAKKVSTVSLVYALLNKEITSAASLVGGVGAAIVGASPPPLPVPSL